MSTRDGDVGWHADESLLVWYARGRLDVARSTSLEQHLLCCAECRARLAPRADTTLLDRVWADTVDQLDRPRPWLVQRILQVCGLSAGDARVAAAASTARLSWLIGCLIGVLFALALPAPAGRLVPWFLIFAPLVPVTGVAVAYGRDTDPMYEVVVASPMAKLRLVLLRSLLIVPSTVLVLLVGGAVLPGGITTSVLWLLPALGLAAMTLAVEPWLGALPAAAGVGVVWVGTVVTVARATGSVLPAFGAVGQILSASTLLVAVAVIAVSHAEPDTRRSR